MSDESRRMTEEEARSLVERATLVELFELVRRKAEVLGGGSRMNWHSPTAGGVDIRIRIRKVGP